MSASSDSEISSNVSIFLWENVQNMAALKQAAIDGELPMVLLNPSLIFHPDQIFVAVHKSLQAKKYGQMKTRNVFTEILYSLSLSRNINESFKLFGVQDTHTSVIIVVSGTDLANIQTRLNTLVHGNQVPITLLREFNNVELIRKVYKIPKITDDELLESVISKIAVKDIV